MDETPLQGQNPPDTGNCETPLVKEKLPSKNGLQNGTEC